MSRPILLVMVLVASACGSDEETSTPTEASFEPTGLEAESLEFDGHLITAATFRLLGQGTATYGGALRIRVLERDEVVCETAEMPTRSVATPMGDERGRPLGAMSFLGACPAPTAGATRVVRFEYAPLRGSNVSGELAEIPAALAPTSGPTGAPCAPAADCLRLGRGALIVGDQAAARGFFETGCSTGSQTCCGELAGQIGWGFGGPADVPRAVTLARAGCAANDAHSCTILGALHNEGLGVDADPVAARRLHTQSCDGESMLGCSNLAFMLAEGLGGARDEARAYELYAGACVPGGAAAACIGLATHLLEGRGTTADPVRARAAVQLGCDNFDYPSCGQLGVMVLNGLGGDADVAQGAALYERSCNGGVAVACSNLAALLTNGRPGFDTDPDRGARFRRRACELGDRNSCGG